MIKIQKDKVVFSKSIWNELKNDPYFSELIEDIEDRVKLESAVEEHKISGEKMIKIEDYLAKRQKKDNGKHAL